MKFELYQLVLVHNKMEVVAKNNGKSDMDVAVTMVYIDVIHVNCA